jgi:hypothetical protein
LELFRLSGAKLCHSKCRDFKCTKRALTFRGKTGWCNWTNEPCDPKGCTYALCQKRQLLPDGRCGLTIKRKTHEEIQPEDMFKEEIRLKGKLARKTGERSIF